MDLDNDIKPAVLVDDSAVKEEESSGFPTLTGRSTEDVMCPGDESFPDSARTFPNKRQMRREKERNLKETAEKKPFFSQDSDKIRQRVLTLARTIKNPFGPRQFLKEYTKAFGCYDIPIELPKGHCRPELGKFFKNFKDVRPYSSSFVYVGSDAFDGIIHANEVDSIQKNITDLMTELNMPMRTAEIWNAYRKKYGESAALEELQRHEFRYHQFLLVHPELKCKKLFRNLVFALRGQEIPAFRVEPQEVDARLPPDLQEKIVALMKTFKEPVTAGEICSAYEKKYGVPFVPKKPCTQHKLKQFFKQHPKLKCVGHGSYFKLKEDRPDEEMKVGTSSSSDSEEGEEGFDEAHFLDLREKITDLLETFEEPAAVYGVPFAPKKVNTRQHLKLKDNRPDEEKEGGASSSSDSEGQKEEEKNSSSSLFKEFINKVGTVAKDFPHCFSEKRLLTAYSCRYPSNLLVDAKRFGYGSFLKLVAVIPEIRAKKNGVLFDWVGECSETEKRKEFKELKEQIKGMVQGMKTVGVGEINQAYFKVYGQYVPYHKFGYKDVRRCLLGLKIEGITKLKSRSKGHK